MKYKPSQVTDRSWLHAKRVVGVYPAHTDRGGKWMVFVSRGQVDEAWAKIEEAIEKGLLGDSAKVATAKPNPHAKNPGNHVICVYTYDGGDEADVWRIRGALRELGFLKTLSWKPDSATLAGKYAKEGHKGISRFRG